AISRSIFMAGWGLRNRPYFPGLCRGLSSRHPGSIEMTKRVAFVTIGQTPRSDLVPEILARIGVPIEAVEFGALDGMSAAEIAAAAPRPGEASLATRLAGGGETVVAKEWAQGRLQQIFDRIDRERFDLLVLL